ncbi:MAG: hypothetical protein FJZ01_09235 [Candidatus Sericytochromatia bacterium]|nr:hypothetical protein [Candidatus Tanganyikabacteria bacterium]
MQIVRESTLVLPFRFLRQPGPPLPDILLRPEHVPEPPPELRWLRLGAPSTDDPALDDYLVAAPAEGAALTVDHVALAIAFEVDAPPDLTGPDHLALHLEEAARRLTRDVLGRFLFHLKFRTRTIWLAHAGSPIGGRVTWRLDGRAAQAGRPERTPIAPGRGLTAEIWSRLASDLQAGSEPAPHELALFQARELLAVGMRAMAVLSAAVACETKARSAVAILQAARPGGLDDPEYLRLTSRHAKVPACQVLSSVLDKVCGRNLARENRALFESVERLFNARNTVAHTGRCALREGSLERAVDLVEVAAFLAAVEEVGAWLDGLSLLNSCLDPHDRLNSA